MSINVQPIPPNLGSALDTAVFLPAANFVHLAPRTTLAGKVQEAQLIPIDLQVKSK